MIHARFFRAAALALSVAFSGGAAVAADDLYLMVPANPGGGWDQTGRALAEVLKAEGLAGAVEVENVGGAGGTKGLAQFATSKEGDAGAMMVMGLVMTGAIKTNKSPVTLANATPLARLTTEYEALVVPADSPIKSMADLVTTLKASPKAVSWGGGSAGGVDHILVGLIAKAAGVAPGDVNYVAHSGGGEAMAAILGGHVTVGVSGVGEFAEQVKSGKLRYLAVSSPEKLANVEAPTLKESGVDVSIGNWRGIVGAPKISADEAKALVGTLDKAAASAAWKKVLADKGWGDAYLSGEAFAKFLAEDDARVGATLKDIGLLKD